jgi:hypothetical protein
MVASYLTMAIVCVTPSPRQLLLHTPVPRYDTTHAPWSLHIYIYMINIHLDSGTVCRVITPYVWLTRPLYQSLITNLCAPWSMGWYHSTRCLGLLYKLCSTNSTVEQLQKKLEFVEHLSLGAHTTPQFFLEQNAWSWNRLAKKREAELKNVSRAVPNIP